MNISRFPHSFAKKFLFLFGFLGMFLTFSVYALSLNLVKTPTISSPSFLNTGTTSSSPTTGTVTTRTPTISPRPAIVSGEISRSGSTPATKRKISTGPTINVTTLFQKSVATKWTFTRLKPAILNTPIGATLKLCDDSVNCSGDVGPGWNSKSIDVTLDNANRYIQWSVNKGIADSGLLEISRAPMGGEWPSAKVFYSQSVSYGESKFNFGSLLTADEKQLLIPQNQPVSTGAKVQSTTKILGNVTKILQGIGSSTSTTSTALTTSSTSSSINGANQVNANTATAKMRPTFYVRVIPMKNGQVIGKPTNEVKVTFYPASSGSTTTIYTPVKAYEVKIKSFKPLLDPTPGVCRGAVILDSPVMIQYGITFKQYNVGDRICPVSYKGQGEPSWYESFWSAITSGMSWVSQAYADLKSGIIDAIGSVACGGDATCKMALSAGLDIGMVALGIPPTLPNFDQLVDGGFDYLAGELSAAAGCPDAVCRDTIKNELKKALEEKKNKNPSCTDVEEAHNMGIEPLCLPDGVKSHLDPLALYRDAMIILTVKRTKAPVGDEQKFATSKAYRLQFTATAKNATPVGKVINNIEPHNKSVKITKPLEGELFQSKNIPIPYIAPGESIDIPLQLVATDYWVPGHKEAMDGWSTTIFHDGYPEYQYNDWWLLYLGANLNISTSIDGCDNAWSSDCIISKTSMDTVISKKSVYQ